MLAQFPTVTAGQIGVLLAVILAGCAGVAIIYNADKIFSSRFARKTEVDLLRVELNAAIASLRSDLNTLRTSTVTSVEARTEKIDSKLTLIIDALERRKHG